MKNAGINNDSGSGLGGGGGGGGVEGGAEGREDAGFRGNVGGVAGPDGFSHVGV